jgi:uncharacterized membrane protein YsdA (DUF1294 family)
MTPGALLFGWLVAVNVVTFAAYWRDKRAARRGGRRTHERTLLALNLAGGFVGGWAGMLVLRHKSRHASFRLVQSLATLLWAALVLALLLWSPGG